MLYIFAFVLLAGSFLVGMTWMRIGLFNLSGNRIESWLQTFTNTPLMGMIAGIGMTIILQSSSAVTVIAIGLVSARILTFPQTIGIILGTNIGTTITLEFFTFDLSQIIIPTAIIGIGLQFLRNAKWKSWSFIFLGISMIFASMSGFELLANTLKDIPAIQNLIHLMKNNIGFSFLTGTLLTALIQSSTVMTGIAMTFMNSDILTIDAGIAVMIGANIGTCTTGLLASIGSGNEARLTAFAHAWVNIIGALIFIPCISLLSQVCTLLSDSPATQLAHASVLFNVIVSLIILPFAQKFARYITWLHGKKHYS